AQRLFYDEIMFLCFAFIFSLDICFQE
uniref:Uncharacterized protein n=1 Tax=Callithrix jacchus TaxID=9483 RepID=A0A5F4VU68_CALJA